MLQRFVGRTGLRVSRLGLGTLTWGRDTDEHEAREQLTAFVDAGGTLVDTAASYGEGAAEVLLGELLRDAVSRDDVVLATKAGVSRRGGERRLDVSRGALLATLDASLRRLGADHVDLWQVHVWSDDVPWEETLSALDLAVSSGRAVYVGVSNYAGWQMSQAATWQRAVPGRACLAANQVEYSLVHRAPETDVVPAVRSAGMGLLAWAPLGRGVLTGKYRSGTPADSRAASPVFAEYVGARMDDRAARVVEAVARAADGLGWSPLEVSLAWVRDRPGVTAALAGARTAAQLRGSLGAEECELPEEIRSALDDVSAPVSGPAGP
jgi:aryl-alcohol dehydrogenase-like predicted oxidoreductase